MRFKAEGELGSQHSSTGPIQRFNAPTHSAFVGIMRASFWKAFWLTMRPYLIFVSGAAGLVGLSFVPSLRPAQFLLAFPPLLLSYGLGQALTDCFQTDTDAISSPYRPLVRGIVARKQVLAVSLSGLFLGIGVLAFMNPLILAVGGTAVLGLMSYTIFKKKWWGGPFWNSWIVALLPVIGRMVDPGFQLKQAFPLGDSQSLAFISAVLAVHFGYGNFVVMGYLKDISADRRTGYRTFPVVFGWKATAFYSDALALAAALFTGLALFSLGARNRIALAVLITACTVSVLAQVKIHRIRDERLAYGPIACVVRTFILYSLAVVIAQGKLWIVFAAAFYLFFEAALRCRPEKTQV
ncbi:MAG: UbiA family prenyltransferase [Candidatus Aminicenantes bacterium]|nr:UbiA family prenyltransferase [Candidatus Aminicenantes bacterium]